MLLSLNYQHNLWIKFQLKASWIVKLPNSVQLRCWKFTLVQFLDGTVTQLSKYSLPTWPTSILTFIPFPARNARTLVNQPGCSCNIPSRCSISVSKSCLKGYILPHTREDMDRACIYAFLSFLLTSLPVCPHGKLHPRIYEPGTWLYTTRRLTQHFENSEHSSSYQSSLCGGKRPRGRARCIACTAQFWSNLQPSLLGSRVMFWDIDAGLAPSWQCFHQIDEHSEMCSIVWGPLITKAFYESCYQDIETNSFFKQTL